MTFQLKCHSRIWKRDKDKFLEKLNGRDKSYQQSLRYLPGQVENMTVCHSDSYDSFDGKVLNDKLALRSGDSRLICESSNYDFGKAEVHDYFMCFSPRHLSDTSENQIFIQYPQLAAYAFNSRAISATNNDRPAPIVFQNVTSGCSFYGEFRSRPVPIHNNFIIVAAPDLRTSHLVFSPLDDKVLCHLFNILSAGFLLARKLYPAAVFRCDRLARGHDTRAVFVVYTMVSVYIDAPIHLYGLSRQDIEEGEDIYDRSVDTVDGVLTVKSCMKILATLIRDPNHT